MTTITVPDGERRKSELPCPPTFDTSLARFGVILLALLLPVFLLMQIDARLIDGVSVWTKPAKFLASIAIHVLTFAWALGMVAPEARQTRAMRRWVSLLIGANVFELAWIGWQAAHGQASHFNYSTPLTSVMYALMGLSALLIVAINIPLARAIARHPAPGLSPELARAIILGLLITTFLGGGSGLFMSQQTGHAIGPIGGPFPAFWLEPGSAETCGWRISSAFTRNSIRAGSGAWLAAGRRAATHPRHCCRALCGRHAVRFRTGADGECVPCDFDPRPYRPCLHGGRAGAWLAGRNPADRPGELSQFASAPSLSRRSGSSARQRGSRSAV